jgi:glycosyltransferase involved in cell wall biosynthesis
MNPAVSLLVPVFNRAELLVPCLDSALAQTMPDLEVVVVDGASTDGTWDVCLRYAAADSRVRIFRDPVNSGPARGWWRCIGEARGTYATFLWSDDLLYPTFLERTLPVLADDDVGFVLTAAEIGAEPGAGEISYAQRSRHIPSREFIEGSLPGTGTYPVSPACALFRLADLRESFMMELPTKPKSDLSATGAGVDLLLYLLTALRYPRVACLSEPLAFFRAHAGSLTVDGRGGQVALDYALAKSWFAQTNGDRELGRVILARHWMHEMRTSRRLVSPTVAARRYGHMVNTKELVMAAATHLVTGATRAAAASIRRQNQSPSRTRSRRQ